MGVGMHKKAHARNAHTWSIAPDCEYLVLHKDFFSEIAECSICEVLISGIRIIISKINLLFFRSHLRLPEVIEHFFLGNRGYACICTNEGCHNY